MNIKPTMWSITIEQALFWKCNGMWFNSFLILCAFIVFTFSQLCRKGLGSLACITTPIEQCGASTVSAQFMNPRPSCTRRLVWRSVCGALPENEFSLKHMPPADSFPFLIWNSNFYNEHQFPVRMRGGGKVLPSLSFGRRQLS